MGLDMAHDTLPLIETGRVHVEVVMCDLSKYLVSAACYSRFHL